MSSSEDKKNGMVSGQMIITIFLVCLICVLCGGAYYSDRMMKQTFDSALEKMNNRSENWSPSDRLTDPMADVSRWCVVGVADDEKAVLYDYLIALSYDHPYYSGTASEDALEKQHFYMDYCIPKYYSGYYSSEIMKYRDVINECYDRLREVQKWTDNKKCHIFGCKRKVAIEVLPDGIVNAYDSCWAHKCLAAGCSEDRTAENYCALHNPNKRICPFTRCSETAYYACKTG